MDDAELGQLLAAGVVAVILAVIRWVIKREVWVVSTDKLQYTPVGETASRTLYKGERVPDDEVAVAREANAAGLKQVKRSWLSMLVVGVDNRTSTSKTVAFAWTLAIGWGLLAIVFAKWAGSSSGYDAMVGRDLQQEYLLLLGGPYAAAVLAKIDRQSEAGSEGSPPAASGDASAQQLVTNDEGDADLGDFQYVLFNLIGLLFFVGEFLDTPTKGFPDLPDVLTGLMLTSVAGYTAKKLIAGSKPTLTSVVPVSAAAGGTIKIYGQNLVIPASVSPTKTSMSPCVSIGGQEATVTEQDQILGADRLTVSLHAAATAGAGTITVVRADGVPALGPAGSDGLPFTVSAPTPPTGSAQPPPSQ